MQNKTEVWTLDPVTAELELGVVPYDTLVQNSIDYEYKLDLTNRYVVQELDQVQLTDI